MVYKERYRIGIEDVAHNSQATNKALLSIMEDIVPILLTLDTECLKLRQNTGLGYCLTGKSRL